MEPIQLYKIENKSEAIWVISSVSHTPNLKRIPKKNHVHYEQMFSADVVCHNLRGDTDPMSKPYIGQNFGRFLFETITPVDVKDLPLYINFKKSPLFYKIMKGDV